SLRCPASTLCSCASRALHGGVGSPRIATGAYSGGARSRTLAARARELRHRRLRPEAADMLRRSRTAILFGRALRLHCPCCGGAPLFTSWFRMRPRCPGCGLRLEREAGYFTGAMAVNLITAELVFAC